MNEHAARLHIFVEITSRGRCECKDLTPVEILASIDLDNNDTNILNHLCIPCNAAHYQTIKNWKDDIPGLVHFSKFLIKYYKCWCFDANWSCSRCRYLCSIEALA